MLTFVTFMSALRCESDPRWHLIANSTQRRLTSSDNCIHLGPMSQKCYFMWPLPIFQPINAHIRQSIHDCIPKHVLGDKMRKSVLNPIRNSAINLIEDLHSLWPDKPFAVSTIDWNSCQSTMVRNQRDARRFAHEAGSTLENVSFYRFQIRLDDFRGYLLKSIAEQTADEATIEEVHSLPFISLTFGF